MFKVGQKIVCIADNASANRLSLGGIYIVEQVFENRVKLEGINEFEFFQDRFKALADEPEQKPDGDYERPVWIVRGPNTLQECDSEPTACELAKEKARENPGQFFTVLSPMTRYRKADVDAADMSLYQTAAEYDDEKLATF